MILNTHPSNRKEMVQAISEHVDTRAQYMGLPSYAFVIGPLTVNKDGTISCESSECLDALKPFLVEHGWLDAEPEELETVTESDEVPEQEDSEEENPEAPEEAPITCVNINIPVHDWNVAQLTNLLRTIYSKQYLLNRMMQGDTIYIEESFVTAITDNPPADPDDFKARVQHAVEAECIRGVAFENGKFLFTTPHRPEEPTRWVIFNGLLTGILKSARTASRVSIRQLNDPENEKYHVNIWLLRLGFGGAEHKELRRTLMHHLNGYAAFKSEADMLAHREKYAQLRRERRKEEKHEQTDA